MTNKVKLTVARIAAFSCPDDKKQAFLWDADTPHLGVKIRPRGTPAFIYQGSLFRKPIQLVIGSALTWKIPEAQAEARRMQVLVDKKIHPQDERDASVAAAAQVLAEKEKTAVTVGEVWDIYVPRGVGKKGKPWSETYKKSLASAMHAGGEKFYRCGDRRTVTGPLFHLRDIPLNELDDDLLADIIGDELERIGERARQEKTENPAGYVTVKLAVEWLSGMFRWAGKQKEYKLLVQGNPARSETVQDGIPYQAGVQRMDFVEVPQLRKFFEGLAMIPNRTMAGYITGLMITGARREELAQLKWEDINFELKKYVIADKSKSNAHRIRTLPLTPFFESVVNSMPRINDYVFACTKSKFGYVQDARASLAPVLVHAKIAHLTPHGLRRTFSLLGEAAECPSGAIEQAMGHVVAGMDEHYKPRRIEEIRRVLVPLENFVIAEAKLTFHQDNSEDQPQTT